MSTLYINTQGAVLKKEEHRFTVSKNGKILVSVPDFKVKRILVYGNVQITTQALKFAMKNNIPITFLTVYGRFIGTALPSFSKNISLRLKQFEILSDREKRLFLAKKTVKAKVSNSIIMLKRFFKHREDKPETYEMKVLGQRIEQAESIKNLRGIEGGASAIYFNQLKNVLSKYVEVRGRNFHPAKDVFNSLLNFLYSLISNEMLGALYNAGFDPYLGFLHEVEYGRTSLTYDLIEPFRAPVADAIAVKLFSKRVLTKDDFEPHKLYGYILKNESRKIALSQYENKMEEPFVYRGSSVNFRKLFHSEVDKLKSAIMQEEEFSPFVMVK